MILYLDSLLPLDDQMPIILRMYLESELKSMLGSTYPVDESDDSESGIKYLINETTLPCYQILVSLISRGIFLILKGASIEKFDRLWHICS
jgi:hypothetical protein